MGKVSKKYWPLCIYLALALTTLAVYWQVRNYDFVNFDDPTYVIRVPHVKAGLTRDSITWALTTGHANFWHPMTWLSYMLDCQLFGSGPGGHHLTNLLLHITNTLLLFAVLKRMTHALWQSAFVAAAFALHPLHVESVAWIAERKDVLSTLFWMLTMAAYLRYVKHPATGRYLLTLLAFVLGLMAKTMLVTLPFTLLLLDYWPLGRFQNLQAVTDINHHNSKYENAHLQWRAFYRLVWEKVPFFILSAIFTAISFLLERRGGGMAGFDAIPLMNRIANASISYLIYIQKMIWPSRLAVFYPYPADMLPIWQAGGATLLLVCLSALAICAIKRPYLAVGWFWFLGTLTPVIGLIQVGYFALADRYTYVSLTGLFIIIAWGVPDLIPRWRHRKTAFAVSTGILLCALTICTSLQVRHWRNSITLFEHNLEVTAGSYVAHNNLATAMLEEGRIDEAASHYIKALKYDPHQPDAHHYLGIVFAKQGRLDEAITHYTEALRLRPRDVETHRDLAIAFTEQGKFDEAIAHFNEALWLKPKFAIARRNLATVLAKRGRLDDAIEQYRIVLQLEPRDADAHNKLGTLLSRQGKSGQAITHFTEALRLRPDWPEVLNNLAWILATHQQADFRNPVEAIRHAERACELTNYEQLAMLDTLAAAYAAAGQFPQAIETAEKAVELAIVAGKEDMAREIQNRIQLYKAQQCYRAPARDDSSS